MRVTSGFIYYFIFFMIGLTMLLALLWFKRVRYLVFRLLNRLKIGELPVSKMIFWIVLIIIAVIMSDSIFTYISVKESIGSLPGYNLDSFQGIKSDQKDEYLGIYKKLRDFYMAQRNFMLTSSALLIVYIFSRFLETFRKLYELEKQHDQKVKVV